ncbi:saccharopine dehydrogenase NADP-binding domain-containing protein [Roseivivax isoporae]|uniref:Saccharopine dehydrogenase NADP binding domain-containing protein n=1 Tax=Roseivivax isoporae LMG 25204 TaxID=1449351 RepID=X7F574_9RHOB|nr:saccharopine dehydrogenase NADP-binding domain-containing protein [Roseivivax isoporae]ETX27950.1 hypothetical protein RISW2_10060 [Roseivivax isoporae LMG 25204]
MSVHWVGTGRAAAPGLRRLVIAGHEVVVWSRDLDAAEDAVGDLTQRLREYDAGALAEEVQDGDVVVSMLPADRHAELATLALQRAAHFVCPGHLTPALRALHARAQIKDARVLAECGFAPGIDHLLAQGLVRDWRQAPDHDPDAVLDVMSLSGLPGARPDAGATRLRRGFEDLAVGDPRDAAWQATLPLRASPRVDVVPAGDALRMVEDYSIDPTWRLRSAVRGRMVLPDPGAAAICVSLAAERAGATLWHRSAVLEAGDARAALVSVPVSLAAEAALGRKVPAGVGIAPADPHLAAAWLEVIAPLVRRLETVDHLR